MIKKLSKIPGNIIILTLAVITIIVWNKVYMVYSAPKQKELIVSFLDVGQGDSIFINTPGGKNILIDGGTIPKEWSTFNAAEKVVIPYLKKHGIKKLDLVIATHPDLDHIGGLTYVIKKFKVDTFLDSGIVSTTQTYENILNLIKEKKINYKIAKPGHLDIDPDTQFNILSPISDKFKNDANNGSIAIKLTCGEISTLLMADIGEKAEKEYINKYGDELKANILKIAHHGGKNSTSLGLLNTVQPEIAIISVGKNNPFGHPAEYILERIKGLGIKIYRTDKNGTITIRTDGVKYRILMEKK